MGDCRLVEGRALAHPGTIGLRVCPQDRITARYLPLAGSDVASVPGIAEPDAALAVNGQVVRGVEWLAVQAIHDGRCRTIGLEAHNGSSPRAAAVQTAFRVESQTIGVVGVFTECMPLTS